MAFKQTYKDYTKRNETFKRNQEPVNRRCTNCRYYMFDNGGYICTRDQHEGIVYRMPEPSIARNKVCSHYYGSEYKCY